MLWIVAGAISRPGDDPLCHSKNKFKSLRPPACAGCAVE